MTKKAKKTGGEPSLLEQLQAYSPEWHDEPAAPEKDDFDYKAGYQDMQKQLGETKSLVERLHQQNVYQNFQGHPVVQQPVTSARSFEVDAKDLPDPLIDKVGYHNEMSKRMTAAIDARLDVERAERAVEQERNQLATNLWSGFQASHPEWAEHEMLVEAAASRVSQGMQSKGVNVVQLMKQAPDMFYNEIAGVLDKQFPQLKKSDGNDEDDDETPGGDRTAGVFGGTPGKQKAAAAQPEADGDVWLREFTEWQHKKGIK